MSAHTFSFYCPELLPSDGSVRLTDEEHRHLARVLRMTAGDIVRVTNGRGLVVSAEIEDIGMSHTVARVVNVKADIPQPVPLALSLGLLPRDSMNTALTQCTEAGITAWMPVLAERCHVRRIVDRSERWNRVAVAALKQSGRAWLPAIEPPADVGGLVARFGEFDRVVVADSAGGDALDESGSGGSVLAVVGPEGGFTDAELARLTGAGAVPLRLSAQRLRAETAAIILVSTLARTRTAV